MNLDSAEIAVLVASLVTIVAILWYFFGEREKVAAEITAAGTRLRNPLVLRTLNDYLGGRTLPLDAVGYLDLETAATMHAVTV